MRDLAPNQTGKIKATFNTKGRSGKQTKTIYVHSNDKEQAVLKLKMQVFIKVDLTLIPQRINFTNVKLGQEVMKRVRLKNTSGKTMVINSIDPGKKKFTSIDVLNSANKWPIELKSDEQIQILVALKYREDKPRLRDSIAIKYNLGAEKETNISVYATKEINKPIKDQQENRLKKSLPSPKPDLPKKLKDKLLPKENNL